MRLRRLNVTLAELEEANSFALVCFADPDPQFRRASRPRRSGKRRATECQRRWRSGSARRRSTQGSGSHPHHLRVLERSTRSRNDNGRLSARQLYPSQRITRLPARRGSSRRDGRPSPRALAAEGPAAMHAARMARYMEQKATAGWMAPRRPVCLPRVSCCARRRMEATMCSHRPR